MQLGPLLILVMKRRAPTTQDLSISLQTEVVRNRAFSSLETPTKFAASLAFSGGSIHLWLVCRFSGYAPTNAASMDLPNEVSSPIYSLLLNRKSAKRPTSSSCIMLAHVSNTYG